MGEYKKNLTFIDIVLATVGYVVGAGIFAVIGLATKYSKEFTWFSILLCGILATCTGLSYSELASMFPKNGGEFFYVKEAMNDDLAKFTGFIILFTEILSVTAISFALSGYISKYVKIPVNAMASILILIFSFLNYTGIRSSLNYNNISTVLEILALIILATVGLKNVSSKTFDIQKLSLDKLGPIMISTAIIYFAFVGFDIIIELSEETKNADTVIPNAMMIGLLLSTLLYLFVGTSAVSSIGWKKLSQSSAPLADVAQKLLGNYGFNIVFFIALLSMSNTILMGHVGASRFLQGIAETLKLPFNLEKIDSKTNTPRNSIVLVTLCCLIGLLMGNLENSVIITNISTMILFFLVNLSAILLRINKPDIERKFTIPASIGNIPIPSIIGAVSSGILAVYLVLKPNLFKEM